MSDFLNDLQKLIVETYNMNDRQPVVLIGHSMGNLYVQYLLKNLPQRWKQTYIKSFISLGGPWGGAVKSIRLMTSGINSFMYCLVTGEVYWCVLPEKGKITTGV
jgi:lysophospholipase-3